MSDAPNAVRAPYTSCTARFPSVVVQIRETREAAEGSDIWAVCPSIIGQGVLNPGLLYRRMNT